jgi:hypothetical protein
MNDKVSVLRQALACIFTEVENEDEDFNIQDVKTIACEALAMTQEPPDKYEGNDVGLKNWREFLKRREERLARNEVFEDGRKASHSSSCCRTRTRVGSDQWWEEQQDNKCECHPCQYWRDHHYTYLPRIDWDKMNEITMDVALLLETYGIDGYQYNECLNILRASLQQSFEMNSLNFDPMLGGGKWADLREKLKEKRAQQGQANNTG